MFYKLPGKEKWQGEAKVIEKDGKVIFIRHGSVIRRVHPRNLQLVGIYDNVENGKNDEVVVSSHNQGGETSNDSNLSGEPLGKLLHSDKEIMDIEEDHSDIFNKEVPSISGTNEHNNSEGYPVIRRSILLPKPNQSVKYRYSVNEDWRNVKVLGPAGKRTGRNKNWL